jgi:cytoskeletal protein CcmA (bactofilin family)
MFDQSADEPAADQSPAPIGMRELPPQPARPVMPTFPMPAPTPMAAPRAQEGSGPEDSVVARDDHLEGTFTSRGTVVVYGSLTGRIEAVRLRIEAGAKVEADVIVDEAIVAGEFSGNLTCRERLEAQASGRINGHVETYKLMLHEGASVEGEMHMLSKAPRDASTTIRGSAPLRGEPSTESGSEPARPAGSPGAAFAGTPAPTPAPAPQSSVPTTRPAPVVTPTSAVKPGPAGTAPSGPISGAPVMAPPGTPVVAPPGAPSAPSVKAGAAPAGPEVAAQRQRSAIVETLRLETMRVAPRATTSSTRPSSPPKAPTSSATVNGTRGKGTTPTGF